MKKEISELVNEEETYYEEVTVWYQDGKVKTYVYQTIGVEKLKDVFAIVLTDFYSGLLYFFSDERPSEKIYCNKVTYLPTITHYELTSYNDDN